MATLSLMSSASAAFLSPRSIAAADSALQPRVVLQSACLHAPSAVSYFASSSSEKFGAASLRLPRVFRRSKPAAARRLRCESNLADYTTLTAAVYGTALIGGGTFAYLRTGSKGSLGGGLTGGALMAATYYLLTSGSDSTGNALGFGAALLFASVFGIRLVATKKLVPAGPLLAISGAAAAVFATTYLG